MSTVPVSATGLAVTDASASSASYDCSASVAVPLKAPALPVLSDTVNAPVAAAATPANEPDPWNGAETDPKPPVSTSVSAPVATFVTVSCLLTMSCTWTMPNERLDVPSCATAGA